MTLRQFLMARGVRQGCPANGFLFTMASDPFFRGAVFPTNLAGLDFLQPVPCACADDFALAASLLRRLMTALSSVLLVVGRIWTQPELSQTPLGTIRKCHPALVDWVSTNC